MDSKEKALKDLLDGLFLYVKFGKREYMEKLRQGEVYMSPLKDYVQMEKDSNKKGRGDKYEGQLLIKKTFFKFVSLETNEVDFELPVESAVFAPPIDRKPVFCITALNSSNFEVLKHTDDGDIQVRLVFTEEQKAELRGEFGDTALIIFARPFISRIKEVCGSHGHDIHYGKVKYDDFTVNNKERMLDFFQGRANMAFWKDLPFEYQQEFRIVVLNTDVEKPITVHIGDISSFSGLLSAESLLNGEMAMAFSSTYELLE